MNFEKWWKAQLPEDTPERERRLPAYKDVYNAGREQGLTESAEVADSEKYTVVNEGLFHQGYNRACSLIVAAILKLKRD